MAVKESSRKGTTVSSRDSRPGCTGRRAQEDGLQGKRALCGHKLTRDLVVARGAATHTQWKPRRHRGRSAHRSLGTGRTARSQGTLPCAEMVVFFPHKGEEREGGRDMGRSN